MEKRIVRVVGGYWRIRTETRDIAPQEQAELIEYFKEIGLSCQVVGGTLRIPESVPWEELSEKLEDFYDSSIQVCPFQQP